MSDGAPARVEVPHGLDLLDVVGNGMDCERFVWIRGLSDPELPRLARIDLVDEVQRFPGELLHVAASDGASAATLHTIGDPVRGGATYVSVFAREDPGEPTLGAFVAFAASRAVAHGERQVRFGEVEDRPTVQPMQERHGFRVHERWRRFQVAVADAPAAARLPGGGLPAGLEAVTLADRPDLLEAAFAVYREGLEDTPGDFPRVDETAETWVAGHDSSPVLGRDLVLLLVEDGTRVVAMVELERSVAGSDRAMVEFLAVARGRRGAGLARLAKQALVAHAPSVGLRTLHTMNHETNEPICRLNESLGWEERALRVQLRLDVG